RHAQLKGLADRRRLDAGTNAAPEGCIEQDDVDSGVQHVGGKLFEVDYDGVGRQGNAYHFARPAHAVQSKDRILEVVVTDILDRLPEADGLLGGPDGIRVEPERAAWQRGRHGAISLQFVILREDAGFEFEGREAIASL